MEFEVVVRQPPPKMRTTTSELPDTSERLRWQCCPLRLSLFSNKLECFRGLQEEIAKTIRQAQAKPEELESHRSTVCP